MSSVADVSDLRVRREKGAMRLKVDGPNGRNERMGSMTAIGNSIAPGVAELRVSGERSSSSGDRRA